MSAVTIFNFEQIGDKNYKYVYSYLTKKFLCVFICVWVCTDVCGCLQRPEALNLHGLIVGNLTLVLVTQVLWKRAITPVPSLLLNHIG